MDWKDFFTAIAVLLVFEGLLPFASPSAMRRIMEKAIKRSDVMLKAMGISSILLGLALLYIVR